MNLLIKSIDLLISSPELKTICKKYKTILDMIFIFELLLYTYIHIYIYIIGFNPQYIIVVHFSPSCIIARNSNEHASWHECGEPLTVPRVGSKALFVDSPLSVSF